MKPSSVSLAAVLFASAWFLVLAASPGLGGQEFKPYFENLDIDCPNCGWNTVELRSSGVPSGNPIVPFKQGETCPVCGGKGRLISRIDWQNGYYLVEGFGVPKRETLREYVETRSKRLLARMRVDSMTAARQDCIRNAIALAARVRLDDERLLGGMAEELRGRAEMMEEVGEGDWVDKDVSIPFFKMTMRVPIWGAEGVVGVFYDSQVQKVRERKKKSKPFDWRKALDDYRKNPKSWEIPGMPAGQPDKPPAQPPVQPVKPDPQPVPPADPQPVPPTDPQPVPPTDPQPVPPTDPQPVPPTDPFPQPVPPTDPQPVPPTDPQPVPPTDPQPVPPTDPQPVPPTDPQPVPPTDPQPVPPTDPQPVPPADPQPVPPTDPQPVPPTDPQPVPDQPPTVPPDSAQPAPPASNNQPGAIDPTEIEEIIIDMRPESNAPAAQPMVNPAMFPEIEFVDKDGNKQVVYDLTEVDENPAKNEGMVQYVNSNTPFDKISKLAGPRTLVLRASGIVDGRIRVAGIDLPIYLQDGVDLSGQKGDQKPRYQYKFKAVQSQGLQRANIMLSAKDALELKKTDEAAKVLKNCKVIIIAGGDIAGKEGASPRRTERK